MWESAPTVKRVGGYGFAANPHAGAAFPGGRTESSAPTKRGLIDHKRFLDTLSPLLVPKGIPQMEKILTDFLHFFCKPVAKKLFPVYNNARKYLLRFTKKEGKDMKKQSGLLRRSIILALLLLCILAALTVVSFAADIVASGYCGGEGDGTNLSWTLDSEGTLTISGKGKMKNYYSDSMYPNYAPWYELRTSCKNLVLNPGIASIGTDAFFKCSRLTGSLTLPDSVTSIGKRAFLGCTGLTGSLTIPNSVTSIEGYAFSGCTGFTGSLTIPNSVTSIGGRAFSGCSGFTGSLTIPDSVTDILSGTFYGCFGFTGSLTIPNSVTTICDHAFYACSGFTGSLTIPNSVTSIEWYAFSGCTGFTGSLTIPNSVTSIGGSAFSGCRGFTGSLAIPNSVTSIGGSAFYGCSGFTGSLTIPNSVTNIGELAFCWCSGFTGSLTIPNSVTSIGERAFYNCSGFTGSLALPNSVTSIGECAFYKCVGFTGSLALPNSVTSIGESAFTGCSGFTGSLTIPNSVTYIDAHAFWGCSSLTSLAIPDSVTEIFNEAFAYCSGLTSATFSGNAPRMGNVFYRCAPTFTIYYVPGTTGWTDSSAYNAAAGTWNGYPLKAWNPGTTDGKPGGMDENVSTVYVKEFTPNRMCLEQLTTATIQFNTNVQPGRGKISIYPVSDTGEETKIYSVSTKDPSVQCSGNTATIDFSKAGELAEGDYFILIESMAFVSETGKPFYGIVDKQAWIFTIQGEPPVSDIALKWEKNGIWPFQKDDYSKPPIPDGTDDQYAQALVSWAKNAGITWMKRADAVKLLDQPVYLPVTDINHSPVLLNDGGTTVRQVIQDIVFAEHLQSYISELDQEITNYQDHVDYGREHLKLSILPQEAKTYKKVLGWYSQISRYLESRNEKSNLFWSLSAPVAYKTIFTLLDSVQGEGYQYMKPFLKATLSQSELEASIRSLERYRSFEEYKKQADSMASIVNQSGKAVYTAVSEGSYGGLISFGADLVMRYFGASDNKMLQELSSSWSTYGSVKSAVSLSMFLGSSIGMFPMVVDLYQSMYASVQDQVKAAYFIGDYYIQEKYPRFYGIIYDSETGMPKTSFTLENLTLDRPAEYATDMALHNWTDFLQTRLTEASLRPDCIEMRRDLTNYAVLLRYIRSIDIAQAKSMLAKYLDAEHNAAAQTTLYVKCPVTVEIYDSNGEKLASLSSEDKSIQDCEYGTLYLMGENNETKAFVLNSGAYTAKIIPYNSGTMNVLLTGDAQDGAQTAAYYEDVMLTNGQPLTLDLTEQELTENGAVIPSEKSIPVQTVEITGEQNLEVGENAQLTTHIGPDAASDRSVTWTSSNPSVVSVSENGEITAHAAGEATISAVAANGVSAALPVQTYTPVSAISFETEQYCMTVGESLPTGASVLPADAAHKLRWQSSAPDVAAVDESGTIRAYSAGTAILQAQADGVTAEISVTVYASPLCVSLYQSDTKGNRLKVAAVNHSWSAVTGTIYVAAYADGKLCFVQTVSVSLAAQEAMTQYLPIPALASGPEYEVKAFVLNELYKPMQSAVRSMLIV